MVTELSRHDKDEQEKLFSNNISFGPLSFYMIVLQLMILYCLRDFHFNLVLCILHYF